MLALASISTIIISGANNANAVAVGYGRSASRLSSGAQAAAAAVTSHAGGFHTETGRAHVAGGLLRELQQASVVPRSECSTRARDHLRLEIWSHISFTLFEVCFLLAAHTPTATATPPLCSCKQP